MEIEDVINCCLRAAVREEETAVLSLTDGGTRYHAKNAKALREAARLLEKLKPGRGWERIADAGGMDVEEV